MHSPNKNRCKTDYIKFYQGWPSICKRGSSAALNRDVRQSGSTQRTLPQKRRGWPQLTGGHLRAGGKYRLREHGVSVTAAEGTAAASNRVGQRDKLLRRERRADVQRGN